MEDNSSRKTTEAKQKAVLMRLNRFSRIMDSSIGIPFTRFRLGLESLIGLLPVVGDVAGLTLSLYVFLEAQQVGASGAVKLKILRNIGIDFVGGLLPVVGDAFDVLFKANTRNTKLLENYLNDQLAEPAQRAFPWQAWIGLSILFAVIALGLAAIF
ncbi:DUF4112 domain-containing protein [Spongiibacter nanhainus]|uniref:DUF4112 domain-containing protein n=2 Tax=Spongiibacter nanhainus TaxID=2794344 RepID=A0A7T4US49_9GAMM|nr:DUF4112 domain-containing protein [Spongiibacter nanhainus]